jgi:hypothetical protein
MSIELSKTGKISTDNYLRISPFVVLDTFLIFERNEKCIDYIMLCVCVSLCHGLTRIVRIITNIVTDGKYWLVGTLKMVILRITQQFS